MVVLKAWNHDKSFGILFNVGKYEDLCTKAEVKFNVHGSWKVVLEDGITIDEDSFDLLNDNTCIYIIKEGQTLNLPGSSQQRTDHAHHTEKSNLLELVKRVRDKQTSLNLNTSKKRKTSYKINMGWFIWNQDRYAQVKLKTGGGSREIEVPAETDYTSLLEIGKNLFFPNNGFCDTRGHMSAYKHVLGDFKQNIIPEEDFTVSGYALKYKLSTRPRVYLMSKRNESDIEEDMDLPDIDVNGLSIPNSPDIPDINLIESDSEEDTATIVSTPNASVTPTGASVTTSSDSASTPNSSVTPTNASFTTSSDSASTPNSSVTTSSVLEDHSYESPVTFNWPRIPVCVICKDRYCDSYLQTCGHTCCFVCAAELQERGSICHVCRDEFTDIGKLYY